MINFPSVSQFLFESSISLIAFFSLYYFLLRRHTFFQVNRFYLLLTALLSCLIPLFNIQLDSILTDQPLALGKLKATYEVYYYNYAGFFNWLEQPFLWSVSLGGLISLLYKLGLFLFGLKLLAGIFKILDLIKVSEKIEKDKYTLLNPIDKSTMASSFFKYVFWDDTRDLKSKIIIEHEMVHSRQGHSLDVLLIEFLAVVTWVNPFIYFYRNSIKTTHEFIADKYVSTKLGDKKEFARIILNEKNENNLFLSNSIFSFVKARELMLDKTGSPPWNLFKYLAVIPIFICLITLFSISASNALNDRLLSSFETVEQQNKKIAERNLLETGSAEEIDNSLQFVWGEFVRINLDKDVNSQVVNISISERNLFNFLDQLPTISNSDGPVDFGSIAHQTKGNNKEWNIHNLIDTERRKAFVEDVRAGDKLNLITKFVYNKRNYELELKIEIDNVFSNEIEWEVFPQHMQWGELEFDFNPEVFNQSGFINNSVSLTTSLLASKRQIYGYMSSSFTRFPSFDIVKKDYLSLLESDVFLFSHNNKKTMCPPEMELEITIYKKILIDLRSLDLHAVNQYKLTMNIPDNVQFIPSVYNGNYHQIVQRLNTSYERFRTDSNILHWLSNLDPGDMIEIRFSKDKGTQRFGLFLAIDDPYLVVAPKKFESSIMTDEFTGFQILIDRSGKSYVRIDTSLESSKEILKTYSKSNFYEIIHIPNFKTKMRVVDRAIPVNEKVVIAEISEEHKFLEAKNLLEFYPEKDKFLRLNWGNMVAMENVGNFSYKEFQRSFGNELNLLYDEVYLKILKYDIVIPTKDDKNIRYQTDSNAYYKIKEQLNTIESTGTVYVDNIVIEKDGENLLLPFQFSFSFE